MKRVTWMMVGAALIAAIVLDFVPVGAQNTVPVTVTATNLDVQSGGADLATQATASDMLTALQSIDNIVAVDGVNISQWAGAAPAATNPLPVRITDGSAFVSLASDQTLDSAIGTQGPLIVGRGSAATPSAMSADNDATAFWLDLVGRIHTVYEGVEDVAETAGAFLARIGTVRRDTAASSAGSDGDNATLNTDALGQVWTRQLDPCSGVAKTPIAINISTATTTEITPSLAGASNHYYICSLNLVTAAANNVALVDDDSDGCGSVTSGLAGGTSAASGWNFGANGGLTHGGANATVFRTNGTNRVVCLVTSAATQLSGSMTVVAAP